MPEEQSDRGVYFAPGDVAGLGRRLFAIGVDLAILLVVLVPITGLQASYGLSDSATVATILVVGWAYLAVFKASRFGTLGYRLAKVQLVSLQGNAVGLGVCTCRFLFFALGPTCLIDLVWLSHDPSRQTLRDKVMGTYVVRRGAAPAGVGPITYPTHFVGGMSFVLPEVLRGTPTPRPKPSVR